MLSPTLTISQKKGNWMKIQSYFAPMRRILPPLFLTIMLAAGCAPHKKKSNPVRQNPLGPLKETIPTLQSEVQYRFQMLPQKNGLPSEDIVVRSRFVKTGDDLKVAEPLVLPAVVPEDIVIELFLQDENLKEEKNVIFSGRLINSNETLREIPQAAVSIKPANDGKRTHFSFLVKNVKSFLSDKQHQSVALELKYFLL